ncbi:hypothetical protein COLO4_15340 [Corchorus olitorius]|uniref:F-box domain-containing protein n=1 Tax=Corchorus olitorius TaxID=93759 RepID=A0A1R3JN64_9ROSI|nr:hypothetical protein COLO4_15340 [Corchorus olitorius]
MAGHGRKSQKRMTKTDNWPQDLLLSTLSILPPKSLLRFKSVSKHWKSLIVSPDFVEHHLQTQQNQEYPQLIFVSPGSRTDIYLESVTVVDVPRVEAEGADTKSRKGFQRSPLNIYLEEMN